MRGKFITFEGTEGVGKSSNVAFTADTVRGAGFEVIVTREPGGTVLAEELRTLTLTPRDESIEPLTELLLMFAARRQHIAHVIEPALAAGLWVICDRFTDATIAYQGYGRGIDLATIDTLAEWCHPACWPDMTLLLDAPPEITDRRRAERGGTDRFEREQTEFFAAVRGGYLTEAAKNPERIRVVDAAQSLAAVRRQIASAVADLLENTR